MKIGRIVLGAIAVASIGFTCEAAGASKLRIKGSVAAPPPTTQTTYFGPSTLVGHGGDRPTGITLPATAPDTTSYYWDTTYQWAAPKNGANKTYSAVRSSPLSGCEVMTITDSAVPPVVFTYNLCADQSIGGDYTVRYRDGDTYNSTSGTAQLYKAFAAGNYGQTYVVRGGSEHNTVNTTGLNGTTAARFACAVGNCNYANFNGSNHRIVRPEAGRPVLMGPIWFEGTGVGGTKFVGFTIDGEAESYNMANYMLKDATGVPGMIFEDLHIIGSSSDPNGKDRPGGIQVDLGGAPHILNSTIEYVQNGIIVSMSLGTAGDVAVGSVAPSAPLTVITGNTMRNIGRDNLTVVCPRYLYVANNTFTDQRTEVTQGDAGQSPPWINPFDSSRQAHSDKIQLNFQSNSTNACAWNYYPEITFVDNFFGRGIGRDDLSFYSSPPFPNPNDYSGSAGYPGNNSGIPSQAKTLMPDPTWSLGDSQGLYSSNFAAGKPVSGGPTIRNYVATMDAPIIEGNIITSSFNAGIALPGVRNGRVVANSVINPRVATSTNLETWSGFGNSGVIIDTVEGSPVIERNHGALASSIGGNATPPASQVVEVTISQYGTIFSNAAGKLSPRDAAEYRQYYRPVPGQALEISPGVFAGAVCPDGSSTVPVSGVCP